MRITKSLKYLLVLFIVWLSSNAVAQERIVVFSQEGRSVRLDAFNKTLAPQIDSLAQANNLAFEFITEERDIPRDIRILPSIYYISSNKKSFYLGRFDALDRIESFIKNEQAFDLPKTSLQKEDIYLFYFQDLGTGTRLKVTENSGPGEDKNNFQKTFKTHFDASIQKLRYFGIGYPFREHNKQFYLNVYPYLSADGTYYVSIEVFSQHHCKQALYNNYDEPFKGDNIQALAQRIAAFYEQELPKLITEPLIVGETITILKSSKRRKSWSHYGFSGLETQNTNLLSPIVSEGKYTPVSTDHFPARINFTFPPPVSNYNGSIQSIKGYLNVNKNSLKGKLIVDLNQLNMGDDLLNHSVFEEMLFVDSIPQSTLTFDASFDEFRTNQQLPVPATLTLLHKEIPVEVLATFQSLSESSYLVEASFNLDISPFPSLEKPDGPSPQNHTIAVKAKFVMNTLSED